MQQRVALCRALIHQPKLLLMDEPFGALDELTRLEMNDLLLRIRRETGASVLFVTHSISEAVYLSDKVIVFSRRPARVATEIPIALPYPRSQQVRFTPRLHPGRTDRERSARRRAAGRARRSRLMTRRLATQIGYPLLGDRADRRRLDAACWALNVPTVVLPTPDKVWHAFVARFDLLVSEGWVTLKETLYGFVLALVIGMPMAVAVANSRALNLMFYPLLIALQSVPKVALAPIILVWLGTGIESKLAIVWLVAFFPIIVDTVAGLRSTPRELLELAHSLRASPMQIFLKVQFPAALPFVFTGAKVAITLAVIGAVIGEFVGSSEGLGFLLLSATSQLDAPLAFAALFALSFLGMFVYLLVELAERLTAPWLPPAPERH